MIFENNNLKKYSFLYFVGFHVQNFLCSIKICVFSAYLFEKKEQNHSIEKPLRGIFYCFLTHSWLI